MHSKNLQNMFHDVHNNPSNLKTVQTKNSGKALTVEGHLLDLVLSQFVRKKKNIPTPSREGAGDKHPDRLTHSESATFKLIRLIQLTFPPELPRNIS